MRSKIAIKLLNEMSEEQKKKVDKLVLSNVRNRLLDELVANYSESINNMTLDEMNLLSFEIEQDLSTRLASARIRRGLGKTNDS